MFNLGTSDTYDIWSRGYSFGKNVTYTGINNIGTFKSVQERKSIFLFIPVIANLRIF